MPAPNAIITGTPVVDATDPNHAYSVPVSAFKTSTGNTSQANLDANGNLNVNVAAGGAGGGAVTIADGAAVTLGAIADAAIGTDANGTVNAHIRGLIQDSQSLTTPFRIDPVGTTAQPVSATSLPVVGFGAVGATLAGNPIRLGVRGFTTLPTEVAANQLVDIAADRSGRLFKIAPILSNISSAGTPITTNTNTSIITAPGAGNHLRVYRLWAQNSSSTGTWAYWGNGSGVKTIPFYLAQYQPMMMNLTGSWELSSATALFLNTATTGANIEWYVEYETLAD